MSEPKHITLQREASGSLTEQFALHIDKANRGDTLSWLRRNSQHLCVAADPIVDFAAVNLVARGELAHIRLKNNETWHLHLPRRTIEVAAKEARRASHGRLETALADLVIGDFREFWNQIGHLDTTDPKRRDAKLASVRLSDFCPTCKAIADAVKTNEEGQQC